MNLIRIFSLLLRKRKLQKKDKKGRIMNASYRKEIQALPKLTSSRKKILLIKMEDIGDYLLFRNCLPYYKSYASQSGRTLTLIGNEAWKQVFDAYDQKCVDNVIWVNKNNFFGDRSYRVQLFECLRNGQYDISISAERWRDINCSDLLTAAANSPQRYAPVNTDQNPFFNMLSDQQYNHLFEDSWALIHEFVFNKNLMSWITGKEIEMSQPEIPIFSQNKINCKKTIILNIAASKMSKRWTITSWIQLIKALQLNYPQYELSLIGGPLEKETSRIIEKETGIRSEVGKLKISETITHLQYADMLITNDSFALHAGVAVRAKKILVLANGNNAFRFTDYSSVSGNVNVLYPSYFIKASQMQSFDLMSQWFYNAPSTDLAAIGYSEVLVCVSNMLNRNPSLP